MSNDSLNQSLNDASTALSDFASGPAKQAADILAQVFATTGDKISSTLAKAARGGEVSFKSMVQSIIGELGRVSFDKYVTNPIDNMVNVIISSLPMFGARASGGVVNQGGAYLVGETGPEFFVPNSAGRVENPNYWADAQNTQSTETTILTTPINININMGQGSNLSEVKRSANQVSLALARAVEKGRNLL